MPPSRLFPAPSCPFDTEVAVLRAGCVARDDDAIEGLCWIASEDLPEAPLCCIVRDAARATGAVRLAHHLVDRFASAKVPSPGRPTIIVESTEIADAIEPQLRRVSFVRADESFFGVDAASLANGSSDGEGAVVTLEAMVGDEAWRSWIVVEREILAETLRLSAAELPDSLVDRTVEFKRRQQRNSPPIRRFVARQRGEGGKDEPIAMIGYAPFATCDLGFASRGVLVRTRDVAVRVGARRRGIAKALLRALAAQAITECGATQVLICGESQGAPGALYRSVGGQQIARCVTFRG